LTDEELARRAGTGDRREFEALVRRFEVRLYSYLGHHVGPDDAADVFQEVCVKLWTHLDGYDPGRRFIPWLFTIAHRSALDHLKGRSYRAHVPIEGGAGGDGPQPQEVPDPEPGPERMAESGETRRSVEACLASMPPEQREVFLLRQCGTLTFEEIARLQGCPLGTTLARMRYAVAKLRAEVGA
jgi:RNA polymerase sigma-70 factor (ECF subfamily)